MPARVLHPRIYPSGFVLLLFALAAAFCVPLYELALHAARSDLHSHIFLIPVVSAYLVWIRRKELPRPYAAAPGLAGIAGIIGSASVIAAVRLQASGYPISRNDYLALIAFSLVCFVIADGFLFFGRDWMRAAAFPMAFLVFFVPMPDPIADYLENASKLASAEVANALFMVSGTPILRDGTVFMLPGITLEVAKECSGIRSSYVLFITSLLASYLFLKSPWRRVRFVASVIPLGLLRNGFRILVIALLCVHFGPQMINSPIYRRGAPVAKSAV